MLRPAWAHQEEAQAIYQELKALGAKENVAHQVACKSRRRRRISPVRDSEPEGFPSTKTRPSCCIVDSSICAQGVAMNKTNFQSVLTSALTASLLLAGVMTAGLAQAKPFKWTSASGIASLDIPSQNNALADGVPLQNDTVAHIPLYNPVIPWAMKKNIEVAHRSDNRLDWTLTKVN